ncbi:MAG: aminodeoxychorismate synthase component I [Acidimicrobiales bacterium]
MGEFAARRGVDGGPATTPGVPRVRFDDLRAGTSTLLNGFGEELRAREVSEVRAVVRAAERAARQGWWVAGFLSYESAPAFDPGLEVRGETSFDSELPLAWFGLYATGDNIPLDLPREGRRVSAATWEVAIAHEEYSLRVKSILGEIGLGNAYQVNFTSPVVGRYAGDPRALYRRLLLAQRPAYGALIELDAAAIVSASPELFVDWDGRTLRSRPMKGTTARGRWAEEDAGRAAALVRSPKERAENVMIVDLIRNDMGKVARVGSVHVPALCELERYPHVWQMVSEVASQTTPDVSLLDVFDAMFPCGSVTGAPKRSAMSIIRRVELAERGVYCGAVGLLRPTGDGLHARFNVAIRTAEVNRRTGAARFGSGGAVVADSQPESEYRELALKARMLNAPPGERFRLLETFRHVPGVETRNLDRHLSRLRASAGFFDFAVPPDLASRVTERLTRVDVDARIRLLLSRAGRVEIQVAPAPESPSGPVVLAVDDEPVSSHSTWLFHKTTRRSPYDRRRRRHGEADDVIMVNERGECTEVTTATLVARVGATWLTPPLTSGCLPGVERARLLDEGELVESVLTLDDLRAADELAVVNSLRGWRAAKLVGDAS